VLALVQEPTVAAVLLDSNVPMRDAVDRIAAHLTEERTIQLDAFMKAPIFGMGDSTDLFNGSATLNKDVRAKATAVALALVAACDAGVRRQLRAALVPAYTGERGAAPDWLVLSRRLFRSTQWTEQGREQGGKIRDVLQAVMGDGVQGFWKYERVAAALMLGLLMKEEVIA
jgi:hypothetical protein